MEIFIFDLKKKLLSFSVIERVVSHITKFGDASISPVGDTASPNCGICDTAVLK